MRPEWDLHFFITIESLEILGCNREGSLFFWFCNGQISRWFRCCVINKSLFHKLVLTLGVHIEDLSLILAISVFVVICFRSHCVWTICLASRSVPDNVFHAVRMRPKWNLHFLITIETLEIFSGDGKSSFFWLWFFNIQICRNRRVLLRDALISRFYHSCPCAVGSTTSYHGRCWMLWYNLVASSLGKRLVIANSRCDRCRLCSDRFFCLNCLISFHPIGCNILSFWYRCCFQNDSWSIFWGLIGCDLLICLDLLCRKG